MTYPLTGKPEDEIVARCYVASIVAPFRPFLGSGRNLFVATAGQIQELAQNSSRDRALAVYAIRGDAIAGAVTLAVSLSSSPGSTDVQYAFPAQGGAVALARQLFVLKPGETLYGLTVTAVVGAVLTVRSEFY